MERVRESDKSEREIQGYIEIRREREREREIEREGESESNIK